MLRRKLICRSREGAWIEIAPVVSEPTNVEVAPVRERGLKFVLTLSILPPRRRSREGAWIEIEMR